MDEQFKLKLNCVVLATDISNNTQYILSINDKEIQLPNIILNNQIVDNIEDNLVKYIQNLVFVNELELSPQLISLNNKNIENSDNYLNAVYGFVINKNDNINNAFWIEYSYLIPNKYSHLILEVTQKLK